MTEETIERLRKMLLEVTNDLEAELQNRFMLREVMRRQVADIMHLRNCLREVRKSLIEFADVWLETRHDLLPIFDAIDAALEDKP